VIGGRIVTADEVVDVLRSVDDPEYPGISIVDLGLVADVRADAGSVEVDLIPTFTGCPALDLIASDVRAALDRAGHADADVRFVSHPMWTNDRISSAAEAALADRYTVAVDVSTRPLTCPRCGAASVTQTSMFGSTRCRSVARCTACGEHLEVIR
jgi:ring-1,2-phenylacetyl-CoA epoxidase subunit PaaD